MLQWLSFSAQEHSELAALLPGSVHCVSSVLVERFLPSCFNKLPYVSICSTTGESELTFQSAGPCALWIHQPRILPQLHLSRSTTGWQNEGRPSSPPKRPPAAFPTFIRSFSPVPHFAIDKLKANLVSPSFGAPLLSFAGTCPFQSQKQQTRLSCRGVNTLLSWVS